MKKIGLEEFNDRLQAVARARKIFIGSGITQNITHAFVLYQEILAEQERSFFLVKQGIGGGVLDIIDRPKCPRCGQEMALRLVNIPQGLKNVNGYRSCWECVKCGFEEYSHKTEDDWLRKGDNGEA